jgi:hypothetical protein
MKLDECKFWFKNEYIDSTMIKNLQGIDMIGSNYQDTPVRKLLLENQLDRSFYFKRILLT